MTVGISINQGNRLESIVVTDSQVSSSGRQSNSVNKLGEFSAEKYHGVVFGSGNGNLIEGLIRTLGELKGETLDEYITEIHSAHQTREDQADRAYLDSQRKEIEKKASLMLIEHKIKSITKNAEQFPEEQREKFIHQQMMIAQQQYDQTVEQEIKMVIQKYNQVKQQNSTSFVIVAFDKEINKIRQWHISQSRYQELFMDHIEIGSGADGSNMYLATNLQGIHSETELNTADLTFFALNAYNSSTINQGVGGRPKVIRVSKDGNTLLSGKQINTLENLSGAYLSRFDEKRLSSRKTRNYMRDILSNKQHIYNFIADALELNVEALTTVGLPYSCWQERANQKLFNGKK